MLRMRLKRGPSCTLTPARTIRQGRRTPSAISVQQARMVLTDTVIQAGPCPICRPENKLGIDLAQWGCTVADLPPRA